MSSKMTIKEKQAVSRIIFASILIVIISLKVCMIYSDNWPNPPGGVILTQGLLLLFIVYLFRHLIRFIREAIGVFKKLKT